MRILLAFSDRDLLSGYKRLFELGGHEVTETFDGVMTIEYAIRESFDIAVVGQDIPRAGAEEIITELKNRDIPCVSVCSSRIRSEGLQKPVLANTYIAYPFTPEELFERIRKILFKRESGETFTVSGVTIDEKNFTLGQSPVTNEELDVLRSVRTGGNVETVHIGTYIRSLNCKFEKNGSGARIEYSVETGFRITDKG